VRLTFDERLMVSAREAVSTWLGYRASMAGDFGEDNWRDP
jgi:hypothetical protein